jgi:hypothetical protein
MTDSSGVPPGFFDAAYEGAPAWEVGRPQDDIVRLHGRGGFKGDVLDVGCGSGANAVFLASKGLSVLGIDRVPPPSRRRRPAPPPRAARRSSRWLTPWT